jgi:hypothetical protein
LAAQVVAEQLDTEAILVLLLVVQVHKILALEVGRYIPLKHQELEDLELLYCDILKFLTLALELD